MKRRRRWTARAWPRDDKAPAWTSRVVAVVATALMFVVSFVAMTTMRSLRGDNPRTRDELAVIRFAPPVPRAEVPKTKRPPVVKAPPVSPTPIVETPPTPERKPAAETSAVSSTAPGRSGVAADSGAPGVRNRPTGRGAAPIDGGIAGVNLRAGPMSLLSKDSLMYSMMLGISAEALKRPLTKAERDEVKARMEPGLAPNARAARLPGEPVYVPLMSGGYAVGVAGISIPVGRSHEKEKAAAAKLDSEYRVRLAGFQKLIQERKRRDSVRADSVLRDSLRRLARP